MPQRPRFLTFSFSLLVMAALEPSGATSAATQLDQTVTDAQVRDMLHLPADARLRYLADDGTPMTLAAFSKHVPEAPFDVKSEGGVTTLQFMEAGGAREIGALKRLPKFDFETTDGQRLRSADLAGKVTFGSFFFATCAPCIREIPMLNEFSRRHPEMNRIAITPDPVDEAREFVRERGLLKWTVTAQAQRFIEATQVKAYPTWILLSKDGRIIGRGTGLGAEAMKDTDVALRELEAWVAARVKRQAATSG